MGGISRWEDAVEMMMAGACAVQVGAALFANPTLPVQLLEGLERYLEEQGISSAAQLTGTVQPW